MVYLFRTRCAKAREGKGKAERFGCWVDKALFCKDELWHKTFPFLFSVWKGGLFLLPLMHHQSHPCFMPLVMLFLTFGWWLKSLRTPWITGVNLPTNSLLRHAPYQITGKYLFLPNTNSACCLRVRQLVSPTLHLPVLLARFHSSRTVGVARGGSEGSGTGGRGTWFGCSSASDVSEQNCARQVVFSFRQEWFVLYSSEFDYCCIA